ncbi:hypothetical protein PACTADRAFT_37964 [Pachysolen tannophilus NRRL Y-2460]|uniref:HIG1 domain-containing protein n=1 Tax=Pachysolen tannophilus NRRL Y-2460 TaxID=669874 RepID=A0A1E4U337_PACTA|nr:hypothetical protein PACTADRAFT_37964 [Pachysolen tannophilus NRRL Y-2460]
MKVLTEEEFKAANTATFNGAVKGFLLGSCISLGIFAVVPRKYPAFKNLSYSIKTALVVMPIASTTSIVSELASQNFDKKMYSSEYDQKRTLEEYKRWHSLTLGEKSIEVLSEHKYKIITGLWALSMWGSWVYVDKDPLLTKTQKFVQARMYAQFLTVALLLGSMGLSMYEEQHSKKAPKLFREEDNWKEIINDEEKREEFEKAHPEVTKRHLAKKIKEVNATLGKE